MADGERDDEQDEVFGRILDIAEERFFTYGFSKVTTDEIAREAGVSKKTLYRYVKTKDELLTRTIGRRISMIDERMRAIERDPELDTLSKIASTLRTGAAMLSRVKPEFVRDMARFVPKAWRMIDDFRNRTVLRHIGMYISRAIDEGLMRDDIDRRMLAFVPLQVMKSLLVPEVLAEVPFSPIEVFEAVVGIVYGGILTDEGRARMPRLELRADMPEGELR